ncbi:MAG: replicative DNA helicase [Alphaproteobacteria bacterium]
MSENRNIIPASFRPPVAGSGFDNLRRPPNNLEVEQALLGAILMNNAAYEKVGEMLRPEHFYDPAHSRIYAAVETLISRGQIADPRTLRGMFDNDPALTAVGGGNYLADLVTSVVTIINAENYAQLIYELYLRRQLIGLGEDVVNNAYDQNVEQRASDQIESAEQKLFQLSQTGEAKRSYVDLNTSLSSSIRQAEIAFRRDSHITGVTTGLRDLDYKLAGLHKSDLIILAGRPAMGKTALATNIGIAAAKAMRESGGKDGAGVAFFSLEMSSEQVAMRLLAEHTGIPSNEIRAGRFQADDFTKFMEASQRLSNMSFYIDDTPAISIAALRTRARRMQRLHKDIGMIIVDYLQLLHGSARRDDNRVLEISEITRGLKALAKELNVPVMALSQLSRNVENREDKRPQLSDLRESGSIEQDADVVMFVYREEYYHAQNEPKRRDNESDDAFNNRHQRWQEQGEKVRNIAQIIIGKNRHGPTGTVAAHFDGRYTRFSDLEQRYDVPE